MHRSSVDALLHYPILIAVLSLSMVLVCVARAAEQKRVICVVNGKPPSVSVLDSKTWQLIFTIPIDEKPTHAVLAPDGRFLYVAHQESYTLRGVPKSPSLLSVVDLEARQVLKRLPVGYRIGTLGHADDGRYVICLAMGPLYARMAKGKENLTSLTVIDTHTQEAAFRTSGWNEVRD